MASLEKNIQLLYSTMNDLHNALLSKNVISEKTPLSSYADKINASSVFVPKTIPIYLSLKHASVYSTGTGDSLYIGNKYKTGYLTVNDINCFSAINGKKIAYGTSDSWTKNGYNIDVKLCDVQLTSKRMVCSFSYLFPKYTNADKYSISSIVYNSSQGLAFYYKAVSSSMSATTEKLMSNGVFWLDDSMSSFTITLTDSQYETPCVKESYVQ